MSAALQRRGHVVIPVTAPRLLGRADLDSAAFRDATSAIRVACDGADAIVNCAGLAESTSGDSDAMVGANATLPAVAAAVAAELGIRLVHVSSCAVQGRRPTLDQSPQTEPFSLYSQAKADGEAAVTAWPDAICYRPPGVHDAHRSLTRTITRLASSPFSTVAGRGDRPSAQAQLVNVADAIAELATTRQQPPPIVLHPGEGVSTGSLLEALGDRAPRHVPLAVARHVTHVARALGSKSPWFAGQARRLDMLWWGQTQGDSWLTKHGWQPVSGPEGWRQMGRTIRAERAQETRNRRST